MAIWNKLFDNKKKNSDDDGQEQYFKDEYKSVEKKAPEKAKPTVKKETKPATSATKKAATTEANPAKKTSQKAEEKPAKSVAKSTATTKKNASTKAVAKSSTAKATPATKTTTSTKTVTAKATPAKATKAKAEKEIELFEDSPEVKGAVAVREGRETANGKFDIRRAKDGRFFFSLYASNHSVIAYSQIYSSITAVNTGIASVIANAEKAEIEDTSLKKTVSLPCPKWEIYIDKAGEYRFRLYAINGLVVCHSSHGYASKSGCKGGIESIKRFCSEADIKKSY